MVSGGARCMSPVTVIEPRYNQLQPDRGVTRHNTGVVVGVAVVSGSSAKGRACRGWATKRTVLLADSLLMAAFSRALMALSSCSSPVAIHHSRWRSNTFAWMQCSMRMQVLGALPHDAMQCCCLPAAATHHLLQHTTCCNTPPPPTHHLLQHTTSSKMPCHTKYSFACLTHQSSKH
jgi:hypothetical protein